MPASLGPWQAFRESSKKSESATQLKQQDVWWTRSRGSLLLVFITAVVPLHTRIRMGCSVYTYSTIHWFPNYGLKYD
jgi:hypothetical protein